MGTAMMRHWPLSNYGLCTVAQAAALKGVAEQTVRNWVRSGRIRVTIVGEGKREVWLLCTRSVRAFVAPRRGRADAAEHIRRAAAAVANVKDAGVRIRVRKKGTDPTLLALAKRVATGDESARMPLIDRLIELGMDREANALKEQRPIDVDGTLATYGSGALRPRD